MGYKVKNTEEFLVNMRRTGLSQKSFASTVGVTPTWLSAIAHQRNTASKPVAKSIVKLMNLDLEDLFLENGVALKETTKKVVNNKGVDEMTTKESFKEWKLSKQETTKQ